ncbi:MAG: hypothetical protein ACKO4S_14585 [Snowella sp.]
MGRISLNCLGRWGKCQHELRVGIALSHEGECDRRSVIGDQIIQRSP